MLTTAGPTAGVNGFAGTYSDSFGRSVAYTGIDRFEIMTGSGADVIVTGSGHDVVHTGAGDDTITTGAGNDTLIGDLGVDTMTGGTGNDVYYLDNDDDAIVESAGEGHDVAYTLLSYTLAAGVSVEVLSAHSNQSQYFLDLTGNELANELVGNLGDNVLTGNDGDDILDARDGYDTLVGGQGNDLLLGGADRDDMAGGTGDDTYGVEDTDDQITEAAGEGNDRVNASVSYILASGVSVEALSAASLTGTSALNFTGNEFDQTITGNDGNNVLLGGSGADILFGRSGNDILSGDAGADVMWGGLGDDTYYMLGSADEIREIVGEGRDILYVDFTYVLPIGQLSPTGAIIEPLSIEILSTSSQSGTAAIDLTGNFENNEIYGNNGVNTLSGDRGNDLLVGLGGADSLFGGNGFDILDGGSGADTMDGGSDSDAYYVDDAGDVINETATGGSDSADIAYASVSYVLAASARVEILTTIAVGAIDNIDLTGSTTGNLIYGNAGANVLDGRGGNDSLTGFGGADTFTFTTALGPSNIDMIRDMVSGTDLIAIDNAVFTGLAPGALSATEFRAGSAALDGDDHIIYDSSNGNLYFDVDGMGGTAQVLFAILTAGTPLAASDFVVI